MDMFLMERGGRGRAGDCEEDDTVGNGERGHPRTPRSKTLEFNIFFIFFFLFLVFVFLVIIVIVIMVASV